MCFKPTKDSLLIYFNADDISVLGPRKRYAVWVQGCNRHCVGCIAKDAQSFDGGKVVPVTNLANEIIASKAEGLTISGGEPFLQAEALSFLIEQVKEKEDIGVIVYTGFTYAFLVDKGTDAQRKLLTLIDILIDGEYIIGLDDGKPHRGSSNQKILFLTDRYKDEKEQYYKLDGNRQSQIIPEDESVSFKAGIPDVIPRGDETFDMNVIIAILKSRRIKI